jgi:hypothetical protein
MTLGRMRPKTDVTERGRASAVTAAPATVAHRGDSRAADAIEALLARSATARATKRWKIDLVRTDIGRVEGRWQSFEQTTLPSLSAFHSRSAIPDFPGSLTGSI